MAYRLIQDIKGYHIHIFSFSNSFIENRYDGYIVSPVIVAGGLPNLIMPSNSIVG